MPALKSSFLAWVQFEDGSMLLIFKSGRAYVLHNVSEEHYLGLLTSTSPGAYFNRHLKGRY
jgi:hypothetical protein